MRIKKHTYKSAVCALLTLLITALSLAPKASATAVSNDFEGSGTLLDPYRISSLEDLRQFRDSVDSGTDYNGRYFAQTENLTFPDGEVWNPIGDFYDHTTFRGTYDGCGHTISNIYCSSTHAGFFSLLSGEVRNLGIESGAFEGSYIGSITSHGDGKIINCYNKASVTASGRAGGITDNFSGKILFSWNLGSVSGTEENTVTAGITSYGKTSIFYSYTNQPNVISEQTFSGVLMESRSVSGGDIAGLLYNIRGLIEQEKPESILHGGIAQMSYVRGELTFSDYESVQTRYQSVTERRYDFQGSGSESDPFLIASVEDLKLMRDNVDFGVDYRNYYFAQDVDIIFEDNDVWNPIGNLNEGLMFLGSYDGRGHVIRNIICQDRFAGFFSYLGGDVRNLGIESGRFEGICVGAITSHANSSAMIINCYNKAEIFSTGRGGGLTDNYPGVILFSWNFGPVSGSSDTVVTAGITSYGKAKIEYTYTTFGSPVSPETFTGSIQNSGAIREDEIPELLEKEYVAMALQDKRLISRKNIVFLTWQDGNLAFSEQVPSAYTVALIKTYIPLISLAALAFVLLLALFVRGRRNSHRRKAAVQRDNERSSDSDIEHPQEPVSNKVKGKRLLSIVLTLTILLGGGNCAFGILRPDTESGVRGMIYWKDKENTATDVLFVGSSSLGISLDLAEIWREYGIAGYWIGAGGAHMYHDYYRMIEALKIRVPSLIVLDVSCVSRKEIMGEANWANNMSGMPPSMNKARYMNATVPVEKWADYFLDFPIFHQRYSELDSDDYAYMNSHGGPHSKGSWYAMYGGLTSRPASAFRQGNPINAITEKERFYLEQIIQYCDYHLIPLLLIAMPSVSPEITEAYYNDVALIAGQYNVPYLDLNQHIEEIGLQTGDFWTDALHLNVSGARKCAIFLGDYLRENCDFADSRGMNGYETWNLFVHERENLYLRRISRRDDYFLELARDPRRLLVIPYKMTSETPPALQYLLQNPEVFAEYDTLVNGTVALGDMELTAQQSYDACTILLDGKPAVETASPGVALVVYDELLGQIVDITLFSSESGFELAHQIVE